MFDVVRYLTTKEDLPPARLQGYDYVLAGNGLFKRALNRHLEAMIPLARIGVVGLPPITPYVRLAGDKLPGRMLHTMLVDARRRAWSRPVEAMYLLRRDEDRDRLIYPRQTATGASLRYEGSGDAAVLAEIHSHCEMGAFWSSTDNEDEKGFKFYGVIGRIFTRPCIILRLGLHGDRWRLPVTELFTDAGPFQEEVDYGHP
jgi:PRTRC genetic system protein A